jgi:2-C-methyl-D-erythritol 4-phosphate cytidylyltransferase
MPLFFKNAAAPRTTAIVLAAGSGRRMEGLDKMLALICGMPVLIHALLAFEEHKSIGSIVLAAREADIPEYLRLAQEYRIGKLAMIVKGGDTRQQSVMAALAQIPEDVQFLCIHDGARPLVTGKVITGCLQGAVRWGAAAAAVPVKDTIKTADAEGFVDITPDRRLLYHVQTPQVFERALYSRAAHNALVEYTDDCQLIESMGGRVWLCPGDYRNIKITTPEDLAVAEALMNLEDGR